MGNWVWDGGRPSVDLLNTVRDRARDARETLQTPDDLAAWLREAGLFDGPVDEDGLAAAHRLRTAIDTLAFPAWEGSPAQEPSPQSEGFSAREPSPAEATSSPGPGAIPAREPSPAEATSSPGPEAIPAREPSPAEATSSPAREPSPAEATSSPGPEAIPARATSSPEWEVFPAREPSPARARSSPVPETIPTREPSPAGEPSSAREPSSSREPSPVEATSSPGSEAIPAGEPSPAEATSSPEPEAFPAREVSPAAAVAVVNAAADAAPPGPRLGLSGGRPVAVTPEPSVAAALGRVALDAIDLLAGNDRLRVCAADDCGIRFVDRSPARNRQWCSMRRCGNRTKARRHYAARTT
jgi:CGNR zinc finger/Putative stress-induced transcription regulator